VCPWYTPSVGVYAGLLARAGDDHGRALLERLNVDDYGVPIGWALFHVCLGDLDRAADWFAKAINQRYSLVGAYLRNAITEPLRASAHWPRLAGLMNLQ
jgi:hypothetical protein